MKNKQLCLLSLFSAGLLMQTGVSASPFMSIGDNTDVFFNGSSSISSYSNVFRDEDDEESDIAWTISPGLEINFGRGVSNLDLSVITRYDIVRYDDNDQLDVELFHIKGIGSYKSSRLDLSGIVNFDESKTSSGNSNVVNDLIETDNYGFKFDGEYRVSPKFSFGAGAGVSKEEYQTYSDRFADRDTLKVPLNVFYELTPKVDLSFGYEYTNTDVESTLAPTISPLLGLETAEYETDSHFFNVGARGDLLPKLTGFFRIGYRTLDADDSSQRTVILATGNTFATLPTLDRDDSSMLGLDADLTWAASPKLTVNLGLSRDFGVAGEGDVTEDSSIDLSANYSINTNFSATANLAYTLRDFSDGNREDNQYDAGLRISYFPSQYWSLSTGYTYVENDSNRVDGSYENHIMDLTATLRY